MHTAHLALMDGSRCTIQAGNKGAVPIIVRLSEIMQLQRGTTDSIAGRCLVVVADGAPSAFRSALPTCLAANLEGEQVVCPLEAVADSKALLSVHLQRLSTLLACYVQPRGGVLLHGALAAWAPSISSGHCAGLGVVLAGPSMVGKTTTSKRLPSPWHSLSDDATLVVRDEHGQYWAHPWPTWSRFSFGGPGGSWDVQAAVPLAGIFFLEQATGDCVEPAGAGQATSRLVASAEQVSWPVTRLLDDAHVRAFRLEQFDNLCSLAKAVPAHVLHISQTGAFWREMERALEG